MFSQIHKNNLYLLGKKKSGYYLYPDLIFKVECILGQ